MQIKECVQNFYRLTQLEKDELKESYYSWIDWDDSFEMGFHVVRYSSWERDVKKKGIEKYFKYSFSYAKRCCKQGKPFITMTSLMHGLYFRANEDGEIELFNPNNWYGDPLYIYTDDEEYLKELKFEKYAIFDNEIEVMKFFFKYSVGYADYIFSGHL